MQAAVFPPRVWGWGFFCLCAADARATPFAFIEDCAVTPAHLFEARFAQYFGFSIGWILANVKQQPAYPDRPVVMVRLLNEFQIPQRVIAAQTVIATDLVSFVKLKRASP